MDGQQGILKYDGNIAQNKSCVPFQLQSCAGVLPGIGIDGGGIGVDVPGCEHLKKKSQTLRTYFWIVGVLLEVDALFGHFLLNLFLECGLVAAGGVSASQHAVSAS